MDSRASFLFHFTVKLSLIIRSTKRLIDVPRVGLCQNKASVWNCDVLLQ